MASKLTPGRPRSAAEKRLGCLLKEMDDLEQKIRLGESGGGGLSEEMTCGPEVINLFPETDPVVEMERWRGQEYLPHVPGRLETLLEDHEARLRRLENSAAEKPVDLGFTPIVLRVPDKALAEIDECIRSGGGLMSRVSFVALLVQEGIAQRRSPQQG